MGEYISSRSDLGGVNRAMGFFYVFLIIIVTHIACCIFPILNLPSQHFFHFFLLIFSITFFNSVTTQNREIYKRLSFLKHGSVLDPIPPFFLGLNPLDCDIFEIAIKHTFSFHCKWWRAIIFFHPVCIS
jgi:hypothetical protein